MAKVKTEIKKEKTKKGPYKLVSEQALCAFEDISDKEWITGKYSDSMKGACCAVGHWNRLHSDDPSDYTKPYTSMSNPLVIRSRKTIHHQLHHIL